MSGIVEIEEKARMKTAQATLEQAAQIIRNDGWTRHAYERKGRHCASGAIQTVCGYLLERVGDGSYDGSSSYSMRVGAANRLLRRRIKRVNPEVLRPYEGKGTKLGPEAAVILWNDGRKSRTQVLRLLEDASGDGERLAVDA